jgi:predicted ester cyclase
MNAAAQDITTLGRALWDAMNARNLDLKKYDYAPDATFSYPGLRGDHDRAAACAYNAIFVDASSDLHFEVTRTVAQGDIVVCSVVARGTHDGPLALPTGTIPPTGRPYEVVGVSVVTVRDGRIVREESHWNQIEFLAQLGIM